MANYTLRARGLATGPNARLARQMLLLDAVITGPLALLAIAAAGWLSPHLGLPEELLRGAGMVLVPFVVLLVITATRPRLSPRLLGLVIALNLVWVAASVALLFAGSVSPTQLGTVLVIAQAAAVVAIAGLQYRGLLRVR